MSPQTRRGRAVPPPTHRKAASHAAPATSRKPAAPVEEPIDQLDDAQVDDVTTTPVRRGRRRRGLTRIRRTSAYRYTNELLGAYVPLIVAFVILFLAVWGWISFGPHEPTPRDNWTQIENQWRPQREADLSKLAAAVAANDFQGQLKAYKAVGDDTKGWMAALSAIKTWGDATASAGATPTTPQAVATFIQDGNQEVADLGQLVTATTPNELLAGKTTLDADETTFKSDYEAVWLAIFGTKPTASTQPTIAFPPGTYVAPTEAPSASASPSANATATTAGESAAPSVSTAPASATAS